MSRHRDKGKGRAEDSRPVHRGEVMDEYFGGEITSPLRDSEEEGHDYSSQYYGDNTEYSVGATAQDYSMGGLMASTASMHMGSSAAYDSNLPVTEDHGAGVAGQGYTQNLYPQGNTGFGTHSYTQSSSQPSYDSSSQQWAGGQGSGMSAIGYPAQGYNSSQYQGYRAYDSSQHQGYQAYDSSQHQSTNPGYTMSAAPQFDHTTGLVAMTQALSIGSVPAHDWGHSGDHGPQIYASDPTSSSSQSYGQPQDQFGGYGAQASSSSATTIYPQRDSPQQSGSGSVSKYSILTRHADNIEKQAGKAETPCRACVWLGKAGHPYCSQDKPTCTRCKRFKINCSYDNVRALGTHTCSKCKNGIDVCGGNGIDPCSRCLRDAENYENWLKYNPCQYLYKGVGINKPKCEACRFATSYEKTRKSGIVVQCDEQRPLCGRCDRKKKELLAPCVYPEPDSTKSAPGSVLARADLSAGTSSGRPSGSGTSHPQERRASHSQTSQDHASGSGSGGAKRTYRDSGSPRDEASKKSKSSKHTKH